MVTVKAVRYIYQCFMFEQEPITKRKTTFFTGNLSVAIVASLAVLVLILLIEYASIAENRLTIFNDPDQTMVVNFILLGYPTAAFILWLVRKTTVVERFPAWLCVSILGSILALFFGNIAVDALGESWPTSEADKVLRVAIGAAFLSLYTIPLTALFYYSPLLIKKLRSRLSDTKMTSGW